MGHKGNMKNLQFLLLPEIGEWGFSEKKFETIVPTTVNTQHLQC